MTTIALNPVVGSSLIAADGWSDDKTTLAVKFHNSPDKVYEFRGLSPQMHDVYEGASSKGQYLKRSIEPNVRGVAV